MKTSWPYRAKVIILGVILVGIGAVRVPSALAASLFINLFAVNGSETETKEAPIKYYLPKELTKEDILDLSGLQLGYDVDQGAYYVMGQLTLAPKESKTIKIEVKDVWTVSEEEINLLKKQIEENVDMLKGRDYYEAALTLKEDMFNKLDYLLSRQANYTDNIERRIEEYRAHLSVLNEIRDNAFSVDYFKDAEKKLTEENTVRFIIEVRNPSDTESRKVQHKHYLPKEVLSENIVDPAGFDIRFDSEKGQTYLTREEEFAPGEKKRYEIVIKDVWQTPFKEISILRETAQKTIDELSESEYVGDADYLFDDIMTILDLIENSQVPKEDMSKYIGNFRANKERLTLAKKDLDKLQKLLAFAKAKKLEELEKGKVKNILQKIKALRGIAALSKAVFGKRPSLTLTWIVVWATMAFVALFTSLHFFTWWKRSRLMGEQMALKHGGEIKEISKVEKGTEEQEEK